MLQLPLWAFPIKWDDLSRPDLIRPGTRVLNQFQLGPALTGELDLDPPIKALFVYNSNPVTQACDQGKTLAGLARDDLFTVVSEQFLTDTADYADIVLPATTQLEQFDLMFSWGHLYLSLNQPAIEPLGEAIPNVELFRRISQRMGSRHRLVPPLRRGDGPRRARLVGTRPRRASRSTSSRRAGWARLNVPGPDDYAPHADGNFPTAIRASASSAPRWPSRPATLSCRCSARDTTPSSLAASSTPYPTTCHRKKTLDGSQYPLHFLSPKAHAFLNSQYANMAYQRRVQGEQSVIIHQDDAEDRGIEEGQAVRIFNERGEIQAVARIGAGDQVARGVVVCSLGHWVKLNPGGATSNAITRTLFADLGNAPSFSDTRVEVAPLETD